VHTLLEMLLSEGRVDDTWEALLARIRKVHKINAT
jgi:hypothetical protein